MKLRFFLVLLLGHCSIFGQVVLNVYNSRPYIQDNYRYVRNNSADENIIRTLAKLSGQNQNWDLSQLSATDKSYIHFLPLAQSSRAADFPNANLYEHDSISGAERYYRVSYSKYEFYGFYTASGTLGVSSDPMVRYRFPMQYGQSWTDSSIAMTTNPGGFTIDYFHTHEAVVDGEGQLTLPDGSIIDSILRLRSINVVRRNSFTGPFNSTDTVYTYLRPNGRIPIAQTSLIHTLNGFALAPFQYITNANRVGLSHSPTFISQSISMYPNPSSERIKIENHTGTPLLLSLWSLNGQKLKSIHLGSTVLEMDLFDLPAGIYILRSDNKDLPWEEKLLLQ